jgi:CBS domain-containing protein
MITTVRDIMTARVIAVREDATFREMAAMLRSSRVSAFPVIDRAGRVAGVVSEADLLAKAAGHDESQGFLDSVLHHREHEKAAGVTAGELMTSPAVTIGPDEPAQEAARRMASRRVKPLPVVSGTGHLVGIVSRADVLAVFDRTDDDIRREVTDTVILGSFLVDPRSLSITVHDGIVTSAGEPEADEVGHLMVTAVRHVEGVVAVRDRLRYTGEPLSRPTAV